jgi:hypothetical protein
VTTFADSQIIYRDLAGAWGNFRLIVGGKDVTRFRGVPAQIGGYQLQEPYGYGPADFSFPQLTNLEVDQWGTGALRWFDKGKPVRLVQVNASGARVRTVWKGFITVANPTNAGTSIHCDGECSGKLSLRDKHPALFLFTKDVGRWEFDALRECGLSMLPHLGPDTGIKVDSRGRSGTFLSYSDGLLADAMTDDGNQWTVMPHPTKTAYYEMRLKDRTTIHATTWNGAAGVDLDVSSDLQEEPTTIYGQGVDDDGQIWVNGRYTGIVQGTAPPFPGNMSEGATDASTTSGSGVSDLNYKLIGMGYLDREDATDTFNPETTQAVKDLQDDAGLPQTGNVDSATWQALYDENVTGLSLLSAWVAPLAQLSAVRKWNRTSNGSLSTRNPNFDPQRVPVDRTIDFGPSKKSRAKKHSQRELNRVQNGKNWTGTLTLTADVASGDPTSYDTVTAQMSRLDLEAGMNIKVRHFDGSTLFHISGINVSSDLSVSCAVDTKARDLLTLGQILERNRQSRQHPARQWLRTHRGTDANHAQIQWSEVGGRIYTKVTCPANQWTVFPVIAGQSGQVGRVRIQTSSAPAAFVAAAFAKKVGPKYLHNRIGDPFAVNANGESKWTNTNVMADIDDARAILGAWGDDKQPCGYAPRSHTKDDGTTSDAPITGLFLDDGGFDYHTFTQPVIYVAVYPKTDTVIRPQRIMWPVLETY